MELYDRAIAGAKENGFFHEEALATELAAEFYFSQSRVMIAKDYITQSYYAYVRWGATVKVRDLEARYPDIFYQIPKQKNIDIEIIKITSSTNRGSYLNYFYVYIFLLWYLIEDVRISRF